MDHLSDWVGGSSNEWIVGPTHLSQWKPFLSEYPEFICHHAGQTEGVWYATHSRRGMAMVNVELVDPNIVERSSHVISRENCTRLQTSAGQMPLACTLSHCMLRASIATPFFVPCQCICIYCHCNLSQYSWIVFSWKTTLFHVVELPVVYLDFE